MNILSALLPVFQRRARRFEDTFGVGLPKVLTAISDADDDPVAGEPRVGIDLRSVGYTRGGILIQIDDPFGSGRAVQCIATVRIGSTVPATRRGLHMSRIGDALARSVMDPYPDLMAYARALGRAVCQSQYGRRTVIAVRARVPYVEEVTLDPMHKMSLEHLQLLATVRVDDSHGSNERREAGMRFSHMVACPCVQTVYGYTRAARRMTSMASDASDPGFTHSQRCVTTVIARGVREPLPVPRVLEEIDTVLVRTMSTLPRGSELSMVYEAHRRPQFVEDALREALWAVYRALGGGTFACLYGKSTSVESIHDFDLSASATLTPDDARRCAL
jgi:GTP cyclohydrolase FolE2